MIQDLSTHDVRNQQSYFSSHQQRKTNLAFKILFVIVVIITALIFFSILKSVFGERKELGPEEQYGKGFIKDEGQRIRVPFVSDYHNAGLYTGISHRHELGPFSYPTLGIPQPVSAKDLPKFDDIINELFKPYNDTNCEFARYGDYGDGGYVVCKNFMKDVEAIVNIGINGVDNFGCEVSSLLKIPNYQYDCTNPKQPKCPTNNGLNKFHLICIGAKTQKSRQNQFYTLEDMFQLHNLTKKHILMPIDCDGGEYPGLKYFPVDKLENIDQIVAELHFDSVYPEEWGMLDIFETLMTKFVSVNYHMNNYGCLKGNRRLKSLAVEVTLINKKLITINSPTQSFKENAFNHPNGPNEDCLI